MIESIRLLRQILAVMDRSAVAVLCELGIDVLRAEDQGGRRRPRVWSEKASDDAVDERLTNVDWLQVKGTWAP